MKNSKRILGTATLATAVLISTTGVTQAATWTDNPVSDTDSQLEGTPVDPADTVPVQQPDVIGGINPELDLNNNGILDYEEDVVAPANPLVTNTAHEEYKELKKQKNILNFKIKKVIQSQKSFQQQLNKLKKQESTFKKALKKTTKIKTKKSIQAKIKQISSQKNKTQLKLNELKKQENNLKLKLNKVTQQLNSL